MSGSEAWRWASCGLLMQHMSDIGKEAWSATLLHEACRSEENLDALKALLHHGAPVDTYDNSGMTPLMRASNRGMTEFVRVLCAAGADLSKRDLENRGPMELVLSHSIYKRKTSMECARALMACGMRLAGVLTRWTHDDYHGVFIEKRDMIPIALVDFERGLLKCRRVVIALLLVKRKKHDLRHVDKFLMREISFSVWTTRRDDEWSQ